MLWARAWPALGIVSWVVIFAGFGVHGYPPPNASADRLTAWVAATDETRYFAGIDIEATGYLAFLFFFAWLCDVLRRSGARIWLLTLALVTTVAWAAVSVATNGIWSGLLAAGKHGVDGQTLVAVRDTAQQLFNADNLLLAPALVAIGLATVRLQTALPAWLGWAILVIGVVMAVPPLAFPLQLGFLAWVTVVSGYFVLRPPSAATNQAVDEQFRPAR
jgi:hypothetical protein